VEENQNESKSLSKSTSKLKDDAVSNVHSSVSKLSKKQRSQSNSYALKQMMENS
jgi:hypothetical protein